MSWLPVARRPATCQVSWIVTCSRRRGGQPRRGLALDHHAAEQPGAVLAAARERPAPRDLDAAVDRHAAPAWREHAAGDRRRVREEVAGAFGRQVARSGALPWRTPRRASLRRRRRGPSASTASTSAAGGASSPPAETGREHAKQPRLGHRPDDRRGDAPVTLAGVGVLGGEDGEGTGGSDGLDRSSLSPPHRPQPLPTARRPQAPASGSTRAARCRRRGRRRPACQS